VAVYTLSSKIGWELNLTSKQWESVCRNHAKTTSSPFLFLPLFAVFLLLGSCSGDTWNNPYSAAEKNQNIFYSAFSLRPKHLDPAQSYSSNEVVFTGQIYEPPLQYHYLKRPYTLIPLSATEVPTPYFEDAQGQRLADDAPREQIAFSVYDIHIQSGIQYQPHPAFAKDATGRPRYLKLDAEDLLGRNQL
jgi:peptide/nickel transport system substrate-binding protein